MQVFCFAAKDAPPFRFCGHSIVDLTQARCRRALMFGTDYLPVGRIYGATATTWLIEPSVFRIQIARAVVAAFSQTKSACPAALKSPAPAMCQSVETVPRTMEWSNWSLFRIQMARAPVTVFSQTKSD